MTASGREGPGERWVGLPPWGTARFVVPAADPHVAYRALGIYHPVTRRALLGWRLARAVARVGAFRLLPAVEPPDGVAAVRGRYPTSHVAVQRSSHAGRLTALVLDQDGGVVAHVKLASDPVGAEALHREAAGIAELGPLLGPGVETPTVIDEGPGTLSCVAREWLPRIRPWELPEAVASAVGALYSNGGGDERGGPAHGDFAPWNLLRLVDGGWLLVDWEDATRTALPFQDPFHWLVQSSAFLGRPTLREILRGLDGSGQIGRALDAYASAARLTRLDRVEAFRTYLVASIDAISPPARRQELRTRLRLRDSLDRRDREPPRQEPGREDEVTP